MISPPINPTQNAQINSKSETTSNNKSKSIIPKVSSKATPLDTLALPTKGETIE